MINITSRYDKKKQSWMFQSFFANFQKLKVINKWQHWWCLSLFQWWNNGIFSSTIQKVLKLFVDVVFFTMLQLKYVSIYIEIQRRFIYHSGCDDAVHRELFFFFFSFFLFIIAFSPIADALSAAFSTTDASSADAPPAVPPLYRARRRRVLVLMLMLMLMLIKLKLKIIQILISKLKLKKQMMIILY